MIANINSATICLHLAKSSSSKVKKANQELLLHLAKLSSSTVNQANQEIKQLQDKSYIGSDGSFGLSESVDELVQKQNASLQELTRFSSPLINPISTRQLTWSNNVENPVRENNFSKVTLEERKEILKRMRFKSTCKSLNTKVRLANKTWNLNYL